MIGRGMKKLQGSQLRLMTYNVGGGRRDFGSVLSAVIEVIREVVPDVLVVQEATESQDADGVWHSVVDQIAAGGGFGHFHFGPTLSMREHMHVRKSLFVRSVFDDQRDWRQGNAMFSRMRFVRLGDPLQSGEPRSVPLYRRPLYQGNRDTEPRDALLARIDRPPVYPFVVGVHLTTLVGERKKGDTGPLPGRAEEAQELRVEQAERLIGWLEECVLQPGEVVLLLGDFNAVPTEPCISSVLEKKGFVCLVPTEGPGFTHRGNRGAIDHILVYPHDRLVEYRCWIVDNPTARQASDHLPVVADVTLS